MKFKMPHWLEKLRVSRVSLVDNPANPEAQVALYKAADGDADDDMSESCPNDGTMMKRGGTCPTCGYTSKAMPSRGDVGQPGALTNPTRKGADMPELADIEKRAAALEDQIAKATAALTTVTERLEKAEKDSIAKQATIEKLEADARQRIYVEKVQKFAGLPGVTAGFATILEKAEAGLTPEERTALEATLSGAANAVKQSGLFKSFGANGAADVASDKTMAAVRKDVKVSTRKIESDTPADDVAKALRMAAEDYDREWGNPPSAAEPVAPTGSAYTGRA